MCRSTQWHAGHSLATVVATGLVSFYHLQSTVSPTVGSHMSILIYIQLAMWYLKQDWGSMSTSCSTLIIGGKPTIVKYESNFHTIAIKL